MCNHSWKLLSSTVLKSRAGLAREFFEDDKDFKKRLANMPVWNLYKQKLVQIVSCTGCGKIKKYVDCNGG